MLIQSFAVDNFRGINGGLEQNHVNFYGKRPDEKQQILDNLIKYCKLDTLAMVEIYKKLTKELG
jgi:CO dehydrogenase/acetyl-CoA synthase epsilon subunit